MDYATNASMVMILNKLTILEKKALIDELSNSKSQIIQSAIRKITEKKEQLHYAKDNSNIMRVLKQAFKQKRNMKIRYYSLSSDETRYRVVSIYELKPDFIIAYCHLRGEERTFVIKRISSAALLKETYKIPKDWQPESKVW